MPRIKVNTDVLRRMANDLVECQDEQRQVIADVANLIQDIVVDWEGEAQKGFIAAFENARPVYERFSVEISSFIVFMNNYAETIDYLDVGGREDITRMFNDRPSQQPNSMSTPNGAWRMREDA